MNFKKLCMASLLAITTLIFMHCTKGRDINGLGNLVAKTADQDPSVPAATINGARLHTEAFGHPDSTLIVCIHGGPGSDYGYMLNCKDLANYGYRVVFYDQRAV